MAKDKLTPDPDAMKQWESLPKHEPSKNALPPATGGLRWAWGFVAIFAILIVLALLSRGI